MNFINKHVNNIEITGIRKFFNMVSEVDDAISMTIGQPDFPVPESIKTAMINAIDDDISGYTKNEGRIELRREISKYLSTQNIQYSAEEICVTAGGSEGIFSTVAALTDDGDVFLVPDPAYPAYEGCIRMMGGIVKRYSLDDKFQPDMDEIRSLMKKHTVKGIILSYPCNPTGANLEEDSLKKLYDVIKDEDVLIISDEMYSSIIYDHEKYVSFAQINELKERVILIGGFSKIFSMTGLRVGYICADKSLFKKINVVHQHNTTCANVVAQIGAEEGLKNCMDEVLQRNEILRKRRDFVCEELEKMGFKVYKPKGAFYVFAKIPEVNMSSNEFCTRLLYEGKVAIIPGDAFGKAGEGYVRLSYSCSMERLDEGLNRINKWLNQNC